MKCLKSNNRGECIVDEIKQYYVPGNPQQNGVAERMNMNLNECARSMRFMQYCPRNFGLILLAQHLI